MSFEEVDSIPYIDTNGYTLQHRIYERAEQILAWRYIPDDASVLELGGRFGMVSCVINYKLKSPQNHIVVEPDLSVQETLLKNREAHKASFFVWPGIVSKRPMYFYKLGYLGFSSYCSEEPNLYPVCYCTIADLKAKTGISRFTHLVADCEGGLFPFFQDFPEFFDELEGIFFEKDYNGFVKVTYDSFQSLLRKKGFEEKLTGKHEYWEKAKSPENSKPSE